MYINKWCLKLNGHYPKHAFINISEIPSKNEIESFIRLYILEGIPYSFIENTFIYDIIRTIISEQLNIKYENIFLTGSSKLGFSLSPYKWMKDFDKKCSDFDFFIISEDFFIEIKNDFLLWRKDFSEHIIVPTTAYQEKIWKEDEIRIKKNIDKGFIDIKNIPNKKKYKSVYACNNCINIISQKIQQIYLNTEVIIPQKINFRIYKTKECALKQIYLNIRSALNNILEKNLAIPGTLE
ncbi:hypothetical protein [Bilophila wadsworthia]|uniref:hypothetical protein n=1 Tax=Bilophila wadsworthia TaxID=35833 RepID=UPI0032C0B059